MRRPLVLLPLIALGACSVSMPWSAAPSPTATTSPKPVETASIGRTLQRTDASVLASIPAELALSIHYRRSEGAHAALKPARDAIEGFMETMKVPVSDRMSAVQVLDALATVSALDIVAAAPTKPLEKIEDLEGLVMTGCVVGRLAVDSGGMLATAFANPPEEMLEEIAPLTFSYADGVAFITAPGCADMPAFKDVAAVTATSAKLIGPKATFVEVVQPGHALLHDPILWEEISSKYKEGIEEAVADADDADAARALIASFENFIVHVNGWHVITESKSVVATIALDNQDTWVIDMLTDAGTPRSAELVRRSEVGSLESGILMLSDTVTQEVQSMSDGSKAAVSVTFTKPDASVLFALSGGASSLSAASAFAGAVSIFENAQAEAMDSMYEQSLQYDDVAPYLSEDDLDDMPVDSMDTELAPSPALGL